MVWPLASLQPVIQTNSAPHGGSAPPLVTGEFELFLVYTGTMIGLLVNARQIIDLIDSRQLHTRRWTADSTSAVEQQTVSEDLGRLARLLAGRDGLDAQIAELVGRSARPGDVGEFIAARVFDLELAASATQAGYDGVFRSGPLAGRTVNVKTYGDVLGGVDIGAHSCDYTLVLTGPPRLADLPVGAALGDQREGLGRLLRTGERVTGEGCAVGAAVRPTGPSKRRRPCWASNSISRRSGTAPSAIAVSWAERTAASARA